jgi:hypothetical protein
VNDTETTENLPMPLPDIDSPQGIHEVLKRAAKGEETIRPLVLRLLDRDQGRGGRLLAIYGDVFGFARAALVRPVAGGNVATQEAMERKIDAVRDELAGPNPTPLERILSERAALCWFDAHEMDRRFSDTPSGTTFKDAEYRQSRRDRAQKRFLAACKTLATVRKLAVPAIQVNFARNQVNVVGLPS